MIHQAESEPSRDQLFHLSSAARVIPYRIVNGVAGGAMSATSLADGMSVRKTAAKFDVNPSTVQRIAHPFAAPSKQASPPGRRQIVVRPGRTHRMECLSSGRA